MTSATPSDNTTSEEPVDPIIRDGLKRLLTIAQILLDSLPDETYQQFRRSGGHHPKEHKA